MKEICGRNTQDIKIYHNTEMISIGRIIKDELDRQERTAGWLARELGCNRSTIYRCLSKNSIDTALLAEISRILGRDFFKDLSDDVSIKG